MKTILHSRRGQTLVEALIALSILTTGFFGIITLLTKSFQLNRTTTNDTQATYLAEEGIEIAKNIIDYDVYYGFGQQPAAGPEVVDWGCSFSLTPGGNPTDYALEYDTAPTACAAPPTIAATGDKLYLDPDTHLYTYNSASPDVPTDFTRDVYLSVPAASPDEIDVQSTVTWKSAALSNTVTLEDHFYNWHP